MTILTKNDNNEMNLDNNVNNILDNIDNVFNDDNVGKFDNRQCLQYCQSCYISVLQIIR